MPSTRKPYNDVAGYVASKRSGAGRGWVVIYLAAEQGLDTGTRYAVSCETHGEMVGARTLPLARASMKNPAEFCEGCRA